MCACFRGLCLTLSIDTERPHVSFLFSNALNKRINRVPNNGLPTYERTRELVTTYHIGDFFFSFASLVLYFFSSLFLLTLLLGFHLLLNARQFVLCIVFLYFSVLLFLIYLYVPSHYSLYFFNCI